jgi:hypothetical protein
MAGAAAPHNGEKIMGLKPTVKKGAVHLLSASLIAAALPMVPAEGAGFYAGVGGSYQVNLFQGGVQDSTNDNVTIDNSGGVNAQLGYQLSPYLSTEFEYEWVSGFDVNLFNTNVLTVDGNVYTVNLKVYAPMGRVQPFLKLGVGGATYNLKGKGGLGLEVNNSGFAGRVGGGIDFYLTDNTVLFAGLDAVLTTSDISNPASVSSASALNFLSARGGLAIHF